ncbi:hypothetical protein PIB30_036214 [Stylosanthes scabra]|uniref:Uncharacterized protein n=1 Tax=Stylosanthes scabra TaxID=79078 RepID=A0ABU6TD24_9FABA|nr:hypothetical protein [Stylosanthes scabra]
MHQKKPSELEIALQKLSQSTSTFVDQTQSFMQETRANLKNQEASVRNLEVQVGRIAKQLSERPLNTLPSNTIPNPKEECKAIKLRSGKQVGKELEEPAEGSLQNKQKDATLPKPTEKEVQKSEEKEMHKQKSAAPKIPYPQRLKAENKDK